MVSNFKRWCSLREGGGRRKEEACIRITAGFLDPASELRLPPSNGQRWMFRSLCNSAAYSPNWIRRFSQIVSRSSQRREGRGNVILHFPWVDSVRIPAANGIPPFSPKIRKIARNGEVIELKYSINTVSHLALIRIRWTWLLKIWRIFLSLRIWIYKIFDWNCLFHHLVLFQIFSKLFLFNYSQKLFIYCILNSLSEVIYIYDTNLR